MEELETGQAGSRRWQILEGRWQDVLEEPSVDHIITDPPFTDHVSAKQRGNTKKTREGWQLSFDGIEPRDILTDLLPRCQRWAIFFCAIEQVGAYQSAAPDWYVRGGVWVKIAPTPQISGDRPGQWGESLAIMHRPRKRKRWHGGGLPASWHGLTARGDERLHETPKPIWLMRQLIEQFTDEDDLILDPYCGSGTTGLACLMTGRRFIGCEMQPHYAQIARERLRAYEAQGVMLHDAQAGQIGLFQG
jgi:site-specific DNA-methyltransferase (adenine-specific)